MLCIHLGVQNDTDKTEREIQLDIIISVQA